MTDTITLRGTIGTDPRQVKTASGLDITSFRLASPQRRYDREKQAWVDGDTNWYTVSTYRQLAVNAGSSIKKGDPVIVTGRLKVRPWEAGDKKGVSIEVDAESLGHDLHWGTTTYTRSLRSVDLDSSAGGEPSDADADADDADAADADAADSNTASGTNAFARADASPGNPDPIPTPF